MFTILHQPFPHESSFKRQIINAVVSGLIVTFFLRIFSPFEFATAPVNNLNLFALGYGVITTSIILFFIFIEFFFPSLFNEDRWTIGKNILYYFILVFLIGSANLFYTSLLTRLKVGLDTFLTFQFYTLSITLIVVSALTMMKYFRALNFYKKEAEKADDKVHQLKLSNENVLLSIKSENEKENFQLLLDDLIFIEAADNYSKIVFKNNDKIITTLIRSSLKRLEDQLKQPELFRCHRTYIVQLRNVENVMGNSQGYRLNLKHMQHSIPVSRRAGKDVQERINLLIG